ncbi:MAG: Vacuolar protein sorting-associated protein 53 [Chrysothrix sp. TS-e1954]|nr:MAG: Vacuolar protein sorting-associated protein 53 [Chrysothrix sp. TS-e1954]
MAQVNGALSSHSDLTSADYDPLEHLNTIFSHPSTLSSAPTVSQALQSHQKTLDGSISDLVTNQAASDESNLFKIRQTQEDLNVLLTKIEVVRLRALQTEEAITTMTADIKRLDGTKRNLTLSMTVLKRLQMLTTAYEQLRSLVRTRQYRECAQLLAAVVQLMAHFRSYRSIDQIAALGRKVTELQRELLEQICEDFESAFQKNEINSKKGLLSEACAVLDALGDGARERLVNWYCNTVLKEYRQIFRGNDEAGSLDNISRRYAWLNRVLKTYDHDHAAMFPQHWRVNELLANTFCQSTREDFKGILQRSAQKADGQRLDVNLLLSCLQETLDFEHGLERRFASDSRRSTDTMTSADDKAHAFEQAISEAFEPYLSLWVESQDKYLATLIPKYRSQPLRSTDEDFSPALVIPSSTELFQVYRLNLAQCAKLSTGSRLLELSKTFGKYLDQYGQQVLFYFLGGSAGLQGPSLEDTNTILNTADYCYTTCGQLEEKIKARIDEEYKSSVDLQNQADTFMGIAGAAVRAFVRKVEIECEPTWREMRNTGWSKLENVGDQSSYVSELVRHVRSKAAEVLRLLQKQQYARIFCDNLVDSLTNSYIANIMQCRPISEVGAEQMLLDFYVLKKAFTELPTINSETPQQPQATYSKRVAQTMSKTDPLLKTLQVRPSPPEALVQAYLIHLKDRSEANFRTILDLKGVTRKQDQASLVELFNAHRASQGDSLSASAPIFSVLRTPAPGAGAGASGTFNQLGSNMPTPNLSGAKFDAATFGSALLNAAKDGVDRFGSPAPNPSSTISSPGRVASPPHESQAREIQQAGSLNDNLKNIGRFFRRDMGTFGRFGGKGAGTDER